MEAEMVTAEPETHKKGRQRKKHLYASILKLMEFYLGDSNLNKDRFLGQILKDSEFVDIEILLKFNKLSKLTTSTADVVQSLRKSSLLEVSEDGTKVKRKVPVQEKTNIEDCTIYVQQIKPDATHEWLEHVFSEFGQVVYVSIPKYRHNKLNKGFAFIEFDTEQEAKNTVEYFESIGCKIPSKIAHEELSSVVAFEKEKQGCAMEEEAGEAVEIKDEKTMDTNKTKDRVELEETVDIKNKELKHAVDSAGTVEEEEKKRKHENSTTEDGDENSAKRVKLESGSVVEGEKKKKKKSKRKAQIREWGLQVLPKMEWRKMRNRYLDMQRSKMKQLKQHLLKRRFVNKYDERPQKSEHEEHHAEEVKTPKEEKLNFVPGVIVKVTLEETCADRKQMKFNIKQATPDAQFVDIPITVNSDEVFIRFTNGESAAGFCTTNTNGAACVLGGDEEQSYWEKIRTNRSAKLKKTTTKQRGRDKLLKKAERELGKHIRFDE